MDTESSAKESVDALMAQAARGASSTSAREFLDEYLWKEIWRLVTQMANGPDDHITLMAAKAGIKAHMVLAQRLKMEAALGDEAVKRLKALYANKG